MTTPGETVGPGRGLGTQPWPRAWNPSGQIQAVPARLGIAGALHWICLTHLRPRCVVPGLQTQVLPAALGTIGAVHAMDRTQP
jgi:hypothetical protein